MKMGLQPVITLNGRFFAAAAVLVSFILFTFNCSAQMKGGKMQNTVSEVAVKGDSYAVIFGISNYPGLPPLKYADKDAELFRDFLTTPAGGNTKPENIFFKINEDAKAGTFNLEAYKWLEHKHFKEGDRVYIYFSGHGDALNESNYYLLPYDCMPHNDPDNYLGTGIIRMSDIKTVFIPEIIAQKAEVLLVVDACRTNELPGGSKGQQSYINFVHSVSEKSAGEITMLSAGAGQSAIESPKVGNGHGLFTWYLIDGLSGNADKEGDAADHDGKVSLAEITSYVKNHVRKDAKTLYNANQVPVFLPPDRDLETIAMVDSVTYNNWKLVQNMQQQTGGAMLAANKKTAERGIAPGSTTDTALITLDNKFIAAVKLGNLSGRNSAEEIYGKMQQRWPKEYITEDARYSLASEFVNFGQEKINLFLSGKGIVHVQRMESEISAKSSNLSNKKVPVEMAEQLARMKTITAAGFDKAAVMMEKAVKLLDNNSDLLTPIYPKLYFLQAAAFDNRNNILGRRQAIILLKKAIRADSMAAYNYVMLAHVYYNLKNDSSELYFKKAKTLAPKWADPENGLANFYSDKKKEDLAIKHYHEAVRLDSLDALAYQNIGVLYANEGKLDSAEKYVKKGLSINPCDRYANSNMGSLHSGRMKSNVITDPDFKMAEKYFKKAVTCDSSFTRAYIQLAGLFDKVSLRDSSMYFVNKGLSLNPDDAALYRTLGDEYFAKQDTLKSEAAYLKGLKVDSLDINNYLSLIWLYENAATSNSRLFGTPQKEYDKTLFCCSKALRLDPSNAYSYNAMGDVYAYLSNYDKAIPNYEKAVKIDSVYLDALNGLGNSYFYTKVYDKAISTYQTAVKINPKYAFGWGNLGGVYFIKRDYANSLLNYQKAIDLDPSFINGYRRLGLIYSMQGSFDQSILNYKKALKLDTVNAAVYSALGDVYVQQKLYDSAAFYQEKAVWHAPKNAYFINALGYTRESQGRTDEAMKDYNQSIKLDSAYILPYANLGFLYQRLKQYDKSIYYFYKAIQLKPGYTPLLNSIANVYRDNKDYKNEIIYYRKSLAADSTQTSHLQELGLAYMHVKDYTNGLSYLQKGLKSSPDQPAAWYYVASGFSVAGKTVAGIKYLKDALAKGFKDYNYLSKDPDMASVRNSSEYTALIKQYFPDKVK